MDREGLGVAVNQWMLAFAEPRGQSTDTWDPVDTLTSVRQIHESSSLRIANIEVASNLPAKINKAQNLLIKKSIKRKKFVINFHK